ncbi:MAG TPA: cupin domain-containing protein [Chloroflexota bacterium]|nr:cupin domain-containing protein [Chloroflexota bacterium]
MAQTAIEESVRESAREARAWKSPYEEWKESQGIPTIHGLAVDNVYTVELTPWPARGGSGVFINLDGTGGFNDTYVCEIPPRQSLQPIKHIYEETVFILSGQGATTVWIDDQKKQTFEWHKGSYFAIPPNAWYQHHNVSGSEPARYIAMTAAPRVIDTFKNLDFVFNNPFVFTDRFNGEEGYFKEAPQIRARGGWPTNFVSDVMEASVRRTHADGGPTWNRAIGGFGTAFAMVNSTVRSHSSGWAVGTYKKAHRHGPGIHVLILKGTGYSLMWLENQPVQRIDWGPGSMFVPPEMWFHQHFNTSPEPVLFLAIGWGTDKPKLGGKQYVYVSTKEGGDQIEWEDEDPAIHRDFEAALARVGVTCQMGAHHPFCTQKS